MTVSRARIVILTARIEHIREHEHEVREMLNDLSFNGPPALMSSAKIASITETFHGFPVIVTPFAPPNQVFVQWMKDIPDTEFTTT